MQSGQIRYHGPQGQSLVRHRLVFAGMSLVIVCTLGTLGYWAIGHGRWALDDCAYMVLITVTTVGYSEVLPVSESAQGRAFTMMLLVMGMGVSFYFLSSLTAFIIEGDLREALWRRKKLKQLATMNQHFIVCGVGRTGAHVISELIHAGCQVVVVEKSAEALDQLLSKYGDAFVGIEGDATDDEVLRDAGIERAEGLVTTLQHDQDNLFVALSSRELNKGLRIISRANTERARPKLRQAGADAVISPAHIGGRRMAHELLRPGVVGFLDFMTADQERNLDIEEVKLQPHSPLTNRKLAESRIREVSNALVLAVIHDGQHIYNPPPSLRLETGMTLLVLGERDQLDKLNRFVAGDNPTS